MKHRSLLADFPGGIPVISGSFGTVNHEPQEHARQYMMRDWDLLFIKNGCAIFKLNSNRVLRVPRDHFLLLPPYVPAWLQPHKSRLHLCFLHFSFYPVPFGLFPSVLDDCMVTGRRALIPWIFSRKQASKVWLAYQDLMAIDIVAKGPPWRMACALNRLVSELGVFAIGLNLPSCQSSSSSSEAMDQRIADLCRRISDNPVFPWKISELARSVGLSVGHLDRLWYSNMGINIKRYIIEMRLRRASQLLLDQSRKSPYSINEIGFLCGFASQQFFARQFKKFLSVSPSKYRLLVNKTPVGSHSWLVNPELRIKK
jgi:AraC-like DNA-binding protein